MLEIMRWLLNRALFDAQMVAHLQSTCQAESLPIRYEPEVGAYFQRGMSLNAWVWVDHPIDGDRHERTACTRANSTPATASITATRWTVSASSRSWPLASNSTNASPLRPMPSAGTS